MAISARNQIKGKVVEVKKGTVMAEVTLEVSPGVNIVSAITTNSVDKLDLEIGKEVAVVIKATSVMIDA